MNKSRTRMLAIPAALTTAAVALPAHAQVATEVDAALSTANLSGGIGQAQGLIIGAVVLIVAFVFLRKAFGR